MKRPRVTITRKPDETHEYAVGYKKPPVHTQFKPGQSGNPKGRPRRRRRDLATEIQDELRVRITATEGGRKIRISKREALVKALINKTLTGDIRAMKLLLEMIHRRNGDEPISWVDIVTGAYENKL